MAPLRIFGSTRSISFPPCEMTWFIRSFAILSISFAAALITPGATLAAQFTVSLPANAKSYLLRRPPVCLFRFWCIRLFILFWRLFFDGTYWNFKLSGSTTRKPSGWFLFISTEFSKIYLIFPPTDGIFH